MSLGDRATVYLAIVPLCLLAIVPLCLGGCAIVTLSWAIATLGAIVNQGVWAIVTLELGLLRTLRVGL